MRPKPKGHGVPPQLDVRVVPGFFRETADVVHIRESSAEVVLAHDLHELISVTLPMKRRKRVSDGGGIDELHVKTLPPIPGPAPRMRIWTG